MSQVTAPTTYKNLGTLNMIAAPKKFEHQEARARRILGDLADQLGGEFHEDQITPDLIRLVTFRYSTPCGLETDRTITEESALFAVVEDGRLNVVADGDICFSDPEILDSLRVIVHNNMVLESVERRPSPMFTGSEVVMWFSAAALAERGASPSTASA